MQPAAKAHALAPGFSEDQCPVNEDTKTEDAICYTPSTSGLASDRGMKLHWRVAKRFVVY